MPARSGTSIRSFDIMARSAPPPLLAADIAAALAAGDHGDPFAVLGPHDVGKETRIAVVLPGAESIEAVDQETGATLCRLDPVVDGVFCGSTADIGRDDPYHLRATRGDDTWTFDDPYRFPPVLGDQDEYFLAEGSHRHLWEALGAHPVTHCGVDGVHFAVWAPNAKRVSVVGDFNTWDGRRHVMRGRGATGIWELFVPGLGDGERYKYEIKVANGDVLPLKSDPVGFGGEHPPQTASVVRDLRDHQWRDQDWMAERQRRNAVDAPISIYEVHLGSWCRKPDEDNRMLSYRELAETLVPYASDLGFTHLELLPISEHPFDGSWGYQPIGLYAPTIRHGTPSEFRDFVDACHAAGLGLILDWVPGHFPTDRHGLCRFDGTPLYEHADPREGYHPDWNTLIYNFGRREVANFLIANALYWLESHHVDGLRVDAVASMLYRDYSRKAGEWIPNVHGGRENLEAIDFLKRMNETVYGDVPGIMTVAEESTAWPGVSQPTSAGGLGFGFKWNMGWMNDTLSYIAKDPVYRQHHHNQMTFGIAYAFSENFVLPISHDEVVHGKRSMLGKMPADGFDAFANLRAYYGFMWGHPGKKLLFMGSEFAQGREWNHDAALDWHLTDQTPHGGMQRLIGDLNRLYRDNPALHQRDARSDGFQWVEVDAADESVFAWIRYGNDDPSPVLVVCNFTPIERSARRFGVPASGHWREAINTDADIYGGAGRGNLGGVDTEPVAANGFDQSVSITVPPLSALFFVAER